MTTWLAPLVLLFSLSLPVQAQDQYTPPDPTPTTKTFGADTVHFSVFNTSFLSPEVARSYGITRGKDKFLINVAVQHRDGNQQQAIRAEVSGTTSDLIHRTPLEFREVIEQNAIYYIAEFRLDTKEERRDFRLKVNTATRALPYDIQFNKKLYREE
ncbi:MAG: DUF4426 domain-containing protein [Spongiibacter sp.]|uniref:DUF4426 domain-containing protein n=1 Tax=Spongiibacter thalassae TaxID=2721624 RepID=A0ABX1GGY5_9GAMM|nr:DUF4426 domain-containing protein [Spongiibacter thalassae]NKI18470.1 DUF4426 domain-containing protein [Spongiibacter thalassae]